MMSRLEGGEAVRLCWPHPYSIFGWKLRFEIRNQTHLGSGKLQRGLCFIGWVLMRVCPQAKHLLMPGHFRWYNWTYKAGEYPCVDCYDSRLRPIVHVTIMHRSHNKAAYLDTLQPVVPGTTFKGLLVPLHSSNEILLTFSRPSVSRHGFHWAGTRDYTSSATSFAHHHNILIQSWPSSELFDTAESQDCGFRKSSTTLNHSWSRVLVPSLVVPIDSIHNH